METIDTAIGLIKDNDVQTLVSVLVDLGVAHGMRSVKPEDFAVRSTSFASHKHSIYSNTYT